MGSVALDKTNDSPKRFDVAASHTEWVLHLVLGVNFGSYSRFL